ncbi:MAG: hypothetical protein ACK5Q5_11405 [Planctomycetaceae bacterium]
MTLRQIAEFAALVAFHGRQLMSQGDEVPDRLLGPYLKHSKERGRQWQLLLERIAARSAHDPHASTFDLLQLFSEVLVTEMLTRVWTAVLAGSDCESCRIHGEPIARHVLMDVLQVRAAILEELLNGRSCPIGTLLEADVVRRKCDRWTDLLIGELGLFADVCRFAIDPVRSREFRDQSRNCRVGERRVSWSLLTAGLSRALPNVPVSESTLNAHQGVLAAILNSLPQAQVDNNDGRGHVATWRMSGWPRSQEDIPSRIAARLQSSLALPPTTGAAGLLAELLRRGKSNPDSPSSPG